MGSGTIRNPGMSLQPGFHGVDTMEGDNEGMYLHVLSYSPQTISTGHLGRMLPYKVSDQVGYENITFTNSETNHFPSTTTCNCFTICWSCEYSIMFHLSAAGPVIYHVFFCSQLKEMLY